MSQYKHEEFMTICLADFVGILSEEIKPDLQDNRADRIHEV